MNKQYNILVTGCGGDIGQSIGKILKLNPLFNSVIGCDMHEDHAGKFIFDKCVKIVGCRSINYLEMLKSIIEQYGINIIIPISEPELRYFAEKKIQNEILGILLITANLRSMEVGFDKYLTAVFLKEWGLPFPNTYILSKVETPKLPMILKSRNGSGSKSLYLIEKLEDFNYYKVKFPDFIAQEFLENENEEYTCGLFRSEMGLIRTLIFRRKLMGGFSGFGTVVENQVISDLLIKLATHLNLRGSINVQLRMHHKEPIVFEINPRFSSTVMFRHMMGFQDVIWSIQDRLGLELSSYTAPENGKNFYKGFYEYID